MTTVLVTGASGFIAKHIVRELLSPSAEEVLDTMKHLDSVVAVPHV